MTYFKEHDGALWRLEDGRRTWVSNGCLQRHDVRENIATNKFYKAVTYEAPLDVMESYRLSDFENCSRQEVLQYINSGVMPNNMPALEA